MLTAIAGPFLVALLLALAVVPLCRAAARRFNFLARPRTDRWHQAAVALFGGVGIAVVIFATAAGFGLAAKLPVLMISAALIAAATISTRPSTGIPGPPSPIGPPIATPQCLS